MRAALAALLALVLTSCGFSPAFAQPSNDFPQAATPLNGSETLLGNQNNRTVLFTPGQIGSGQPVVSIASLRASDFSTYGKVEVSGCLPGSTIGGGDFIKEPSDTTSADNGGTIIVDAAGNRFYRVGDAYPLVDWCVDPTGVASASAAVQAAIEYYGAKGGATLFAPCGTMLWDGQGVVDDQQDVAIKGCNGGSGHGNPANGATRVKCAPSVAPSGTNRVIACFTGEKSETALDDLTLDGQGTMPAGSYLEAWDGGYQSSSPIYGTQADNVTCQNGSNGIYYRAILVHREKNPRCISMTGSQVTFLDGTDGVSSVQDLTWEGCNFAPSQAQGTTTDSIVMDGWVASVDIVDCATNNGGRYSLWLKNSNPSVVLTEPLGIYLLGRGTEDGFGTTIKDDASGLVQIGPMLLENTGESPCIEIGKGNSTALVILSGTNLRSCGREGARVWSGNFFATGVAAVNNSVYANPYYSLPVTGSTAVASATISATIRGDVLNVASVSAGSVASGQLVAGTNVPAGLMVEGQIDSTDWYVSQAATITTAETMTLGGNVELTYNDPLSAMFAWTPVARDLVTTSNIGGCVACNTTGPTPLEVIDSTHVALGITGGSGYSSGFTSYTASITPSVALTGSISAATATFQGAVDTQGNLTTTSVTGVLVPGACFIGSGVYNNSCILYQESGTTGGAGVYATNFPPPTAISAEAMSQPYGVLSVSSVQSGAVEVGCSLSGQNFSLGELIGSGSGSTFYLSAAQSVASEAMTQKPCMAVTSVPTVASFTGYTDGFGNLTVSAVASGTITPSGCLTGTGVPYGTCITRQISGTTGSTGVYAINSAAAVATGSGEAMTLTLGPALGQIVTCGSCATGTQVAAQYLGGPNGNGYYEVTQSQTVGSTTIAANGSMQLASPNVRVMGEVQGFNWTGGAAGRDFAGINRAPYGAWIDGGALNVRFDTDFCGNRINAYYDLSTDSGSSVRGLCTGGYDGSFIGSLTGSITGSSGTLYPFSNGLYLAGKRIQIVSVTGAFGSGTCTGSPASCGTVQLIVDGGAGTGTGTVPIGTQLGTTNLGVPPTIDGTTTPHLLQWRVQGTSGSPSGLNIQFNFNVLNQ